MITPILFLKSATYLYFGHGIGPIEMELNQMEPQYIKNLGNWKPNTQDKCYSANMPINTMKVMALA